MRHSKGLNFFVLGCFCMLFSTARAQVDFNDQLNDFALSVPSFYHAYTQVILENMAEPILLGSQIQHWDDDWRFKYSLSTSIQAFGTQSTDLNRIDRTQLYRPQHIEYLGTMSSTFGDREPSSIKQYLIDENGNRLLSPVTGNYLSFETPVPGGFGGILGVVPYSMPNVEVRFLKGLVLSVGYLPLNFFLNDVESGNFKTRASAFSLGASLHLSNYSDIPVLSWLRFDVSQNQTRIGLRELQDATNFGENPFLDIRLNNFDLQNDLLTYQYRGTMAIPLTQKFIFMLQAGFYGHEYSFKFDYDVEANLNAEVLDKEYGLTFSETEFAAQGSYFNKYETGPNRYYSGGILFEGKVASVYVGYSRIQYATLALKTTLRLL